MLDIKKLTRQFDEILATFTAERIDEWLLVCELREKQEKWISGLEVELQVNMHPTNSSASNPDEQMFDDTSEDFDLPIAA